MATVVTGTRKRTVITNLAIGKCANKQITFTHVGKCSFRIQCTSGKPINNVMLEVRRIVDPEVKHLFAVSIFFPVPICSIAIKAIGYLLPHERCMFTGWSLRFIEYCRAATPHYCGWNRSFFMMAHHLRILLEIFET